MPDRPTLHFAEFALDRGDERLLGPDGPIHIGQKALGVLAMLLEAEGQLVTKDALFDRVWEGTIVSESALTSVIKELRRALGDTGRPPRFIESVYGRGYRFLVGLTDAPPAPSRAVPDKIRRPQGNLAMLPTTLLGREKDLEAVARLLGSARLITIAGPGGVGKTCMALAVAHAVQDEFPDGGWFVDLAALRDAARIPDAVAKAMNLDLPGKADAAALAQLLGRRRCLIVIDNCEHLIAAVAALGEAICGHAADVTLLATSQEPLGIAAEHVYRLAPLAEGDAVALFEARARARDAAFVVDGTTRETVAAICRRLDGMPLAVEMAAARVHALGTDTVLARLDDRFRILTNGYRTALQRHQTLEATIEWSHALLKPVDATVFRRLGAFSGSFSLEAAVAVAGDATIGEHEVTDAVASLVGKSLVVRRPQRDGAVRYALFESMRAFAMMQLEAAGEVEQAQRRHAQWCADLAAPVWTEFCGPASDAAILARYRVEMDNIYAALDWAYRPGGDAELGHRLLVESACLWGDRPLARQLDEAFACTGPDTPPDIMARLRSSRLHVEMRLNPARALNDADAIVSAIRTHCDDPWLLCDTLCSHGFACWFTGDLAGARRIANEVATIVPDAGPTRIGALATGLEACVRLSEAGPAAARELFAQAVSGLRSIGAYGLANYWESTALRFDPLPDVAADIEAWRRLIARVRPSDMYADQVVAAAATELASRLAIRGRPEDLAEALEQSQRHFRINAAARDNRLFLSMATVALQTGRIADGAMLLGFVEGAHRATAASVTTAEIDEVRARFARRLSEAELGRLIDAGRTIPLERAIGLAIAEGLGDAGAGRTVLH